MNISSPDTNESWHFEAFLELLDDEMFWTILYSSDEGKEDSSQGGFEAALKDIRMMIGKYSSSDTDARVIISEMLVKVESQQNRLFKSEGDEIIHVPTNSQLDKYGNPKQKTAELQYRYLQKLISFFQDVLPQDKPPKPPKPPSEKKIKGFNAEDPNCLPIAFEQLVNFGFLLDNSEAKNFSDAFQGRVPRTQMRWQKGPGSLSYFIYKLNGEGILDTKKEIWSITINCFSDKDGQPFTKEQLRHAKRPSNNIDLDKVIYTFKEFIDK